MRVQIMLGAARRLVLRVAMSWVGCWDWRVYQLDTDAKTRWVDRTEITDDNDDNDDDEFVSWRENDANIPAVFVAAATEVFRWTGFHGNDS